MKKLVVILGIFVFFITVAGVSPEATLYKSANGNEMVCAGDAGSYYSGYADVYDINSNNIGWVTDRGVYSDVYDINGNNIGWVTDRGSYIDVYDSNSNNIGWVTDRGEVEKKQEAGATALLLLLK